MKSVAVLIALVCCISPLRAQETPQRQPLTVDIKLPAEELITRDNNFSGYLEAIKIKDINQPLNKRDAATLIGLIIQIHRQIEKDPKLKPSITKDCDILKTLAINFQDLNILIQITEGKSIGIKSVSDLLEPYFAGAKDYPTHIK